MNQFPSTKSITSQVASAEILDHSFPSSHTSHMNTPCSYPSPNSYDLRLQAIVVKNDPYTIFVYQPPTTGNGTISSMSLSTTFLINDEPCFPWKVTGVDYKETDAQFMVYVAQGIWFDGYVKVKIPRVWA